MGTSQYVECWVAGEYDWGRLHERSVSKISLLYHHTSNECLTAIYQLTFYLRARLNPLMFFKITSLGIPIQQQLQFNFISIIILDHG